ncbi:MAG TPA: hypothetical protein VM124_03865 [Candidatus Limnocylindrales bacterium]|nr:hypothetical protein [Candidatus Limnocylindrales bacterium]
MAHKSHHNVSPATYNRRRAVVLSVASTAVYFAASFLHGEYSDLKANQAQPACAVDAAKDDTVIGIRDKLGQAGDHGDTALVFAWQDGHLRNPNDPRDAARYFVNGSMALQAGDTVQVMNVNPNACTQAGGTAVDPAANAALAGHS